MREVKLTHGDVVRVLIQTPEQTFSCAATVIGPAKMPGHVVVCTRTDPTQGFRHHTVRVDTAVTHVGGVRPLGAC